MPESNEPFEGGEAPCSERAAAAESTPHPQMEAPAGEGEFGRERATSAGGETGRGVTQEELDEMMREIPPELLAPDLPVLLASMASMLEDQAWRHLGLRINPATREIEQDLQKAKIAIDVVAFIVGQVSPLVGDSQRRDLQNRVATLQVNFVQRSRVS